MASQGSISYTFELTDKMSAPSKTIADNASKVAYTMDKVTSSVSKLEKEGGGSLVAFAAKFSLVMEAVHAGVEVVEGFVEKLIDVGVEFGKSAFEAASFEEQSKLSFTVLLGSTEKATAAMELMGRMAYQSAQPLKDIEDAYKTLLFSGVKTANIPFVIGAATDVAHILGKPEEFQSLISRFGDIQSMGQLTGRNLLAFKDVMNIDVVAAKLGHAGATFMQLRKILTEKPVGAEVGIGAIMEGIAAKEGKLGATTYAAGDLISGSINRIKVGWELMLGKMSELPAFETFRAALSKLADVFNPESGAGKAMQAGLNKILTLMLDLINKVVADPETLTRFFTGAVTKAGEFADKLDRIVNALTTVASIVTKTANAFGWLQGHAEDTLARHEIPNGWAFDPLRGAEPVRRANITEPVHRADSGIPWRDAGDSNVSVTLHQEIHVHGGGKDAEEDGHTIARVSQGDMQSALEQMGQSLVGYAP